MGAVVSDQNVSDQTMPEHPRAPGSGTRTDGRPAADHGTLHGTSS